MALSQPSATGDASNMQGGKPKPDGPGILGLLTSGLGEMTLSHVFEHKTSAKTIRQEVTARTGLLATTSSTR